MIKKSIFVIAVVFWVITYIIHHFREEESTQVIDIYTIPSHLDSDARKLCNNLLLNIYLYYKLIILITLINFFYYVVLKKRTPDVDLHLVNNISNDYTTTKKSKPYMYRAFEVAIWKTIFDCGCLKTVTYLKIIYQLTYHLKLKNKELYKQWCGYTCSFTSIRQHQWGEKFRSLPMDVRLH